MMDDSILSWVMLTVIAYGALFYVLVKAGREKEQYRRENDRF